MKKLPGGITQEQLDSWKAKYHKVLTITVKTDEKEITGWFRKPDLTILGAVTKLSTADPLRASLVMFDSCWLGGDQEMIGDEEVKLSAVTSLGSIFKIYESEVKNW